MESLPWDQSENSTCELSEILPISRLLSLKYSEMVAQRLIRFDYLCLGEGLQDFHWNKHSSHSFSLVIHF